MGGSTPSGDGFRQLSDRIKRLEGRLDGVERPGGASVASVSDQVSLTVNYLRGLTTEVVVGGNFSVTIPNDSNFYWYTSAAPIAELVDYPIATGRVLVTVTAGEVQLNPDGGQVQGLVSYSVSDVTGNTVPGGSLATTYGRAIPETDLDIGIRTPEIPLTIDPALNPGPYHIKAFFGTWVATANAASCQFVWRDLSLRVDVLSTGAII